MNTNDAVSDVMLVITDGWDGELNLLQERIEIKTYLNKLWNVLSKPKKDSAAAVSAAGITAFALGYSEGGGYQLGTLEDIANGDNSNVYTATTELF